MIDPDGGGRNGGGGTRMATSSPENNPNASNVRAAPSPGAGTPRGGGGVQRKRVVQGNAGQVSTSQRNNPSPTAGAGPSPRGGDGGDADDNPNGNNGGGGIVTPELLVDALSGHEDGLLAIAERLMERYDDGYDAMGEAIIDAFADVQKLFQHAVEAAHMEGAAFEASRAREAAERDGGDVEGGGDAAAGDDDGGDGDAEGGEGGAKQQQQQKANTTSSVPRVEEFVDQDVKDVLRDAVKDGASHKSSGRHMDCYELYERACQSASALLPVDSDHRGRLQLAVARAENLSPDRACAILRYAMDDVLRSGAGKAPAPSELDDDASKRGDCVLKPRRPTSGDDGDADVAAQSGEERLDSLVEEMKEVLSAPVYERSPIQPVARRFWEALTEARRSKAKVAEGLEHRLGKIKGDFLLEKAEWEERLTEATARSDLYKDKYERLLEEHRNGIGAIDRDRLMHIARDNLNMARDNLGQLRGYGAQNQRDGQHRENGGVGIVQEDGGETVRSDNSRNGGGGGGTNFTFVPPKSPGDRSRTATPSVVSTASSFAQHARSMVGSITNCGKYGSSNGIGIGNGPPGSGRFQNRKSVSSPNNGGEPSFR